MNTKAISYLILLMDSLGMKISSESVKIFWARIAESDDSNHRLLDAEILAPLICLWEASKRAGDESLNLRKTLPEQNTSRFSNERPDQTSVSSKTFANDDSSEEMIAPIGGAAPQSIGTPATDGREELSGVESGDAQSNGKLNGRYLYGLVRGTPAAFSARGIDQAPVRLIWYKDLGAITHACALVPFQSNDRDQVTSWLKRHQEVLDLAAEQFKSIVPIGFDMILDGAQMEDPDTVVVKWLKENYEFLVGLAQKLAGKAEYGIRITCSSEKLTEMAKSQNPAIGRLIKKMAGMKPGTAYLYRSELESLIRSTVSEFRGRVTQELLGKLKEIVQEIKEGRILKKFDASGAEVIADLAVLMEPEKTDDLGAVLEDYQNRFPVTITFTGPWPGYSFVEEDSPAARVLAH
jgi:hypothetical protein